MKPTVSRLRVLFMAVPLLLGRQSTQAAESAPAALTAEVDKLFAEWDKPDSPGCALAIVRDGQIIHKRGYGTADLEHAVPITPSTIFHVASVSKQFTVMAILMLAHEGKLSLEDDIRKHLPEMADFGKPVRIRHLMHHTSGLRDEWELLQYAGWRMEDVVTQQDVLGLLFRQEDLNFEPGERYGYCNSSYTLLGVIVQRVSGRPLADFCRERIFRPLGMKNTHIRTDYHAILPNRAYSYDPQRGGGFKHAVLSMALPGPTAVQTTVEDMALWDGNFHEPKAGGKEVLGDLLRPGKLNNGKEQDYAGGLRISSYRGLKTVSHTGVDAGYRAVFLRFPEQRFTVIILANLGSIVPATLAKRVADLYLGDKMEPTSAPAADPSKPPDPGRHGEYAGAYWLADDGLARNFARDGSRLVIKLGEAKVPLRELAEGRFIEDGSGTLYTFVRSPDGRVRQMQRQVGNAPPVTGVRIEPVALPAAQMPQYAGLFRSPELDVIYNIRVEGSRLVLRHRKDQEPLLRIKDDEFLTQFDTASREYGDYVAVRFSRGADGKVNGFEMESERVKRLRFSRIDIR